ncbi:MAG: hypothetical protein ACYCO0_02625 [Candidatus Micrarchaeaceae archaeon]
MSDKTEKLLTEILEELKHQSRLTTFVAISGAMIGLYLVAYTAVLILLPNPNANFYPYFEFAFMDALVILVIIIGVYFVSLRVGKRFLKWFGGN